MRQVEAADLFCGAGGTSAGLYRAADKLGLSVSLTAVNHWKTAIATHSANHREALHLCETLDGVDPRKVIKGRRLHLLVASPECMHHSNARGGRPMSDQSRASAWHVVRWAEALRVDNILVENVREFLSWGPLGADGRPLFSRRGETFQAWVNALRSLNYRVEYRILNAADYGDPTTRERLFVIARRGNKAIKWPEPTHSREPRKVGRRRLKPWKSAQDHVIDWSDPGTSIFNRKKPLARKTMLRIAAGMRKFSGLELGPFLVKLYGTNDASSIHHPVPTITGGGGHIAIARPFLIPQQSGGAPRSVRQPMPTVSSKGAIAKVSPFLVAHFGERKGQNPRVHSVKSPVPTVTQRGAGDLVQPFIIPVTHGGGLKRAHRIDSPLPTITGACRGELAVVSAFMVQYNGKATARSVNEPIGSLTGKERYALLVVLKNGMEIPIDICFRMLKPRELARAQSFPDSYVFSGKNKDVVKQIGNAVPLGISEALCLSLLEAV